MKSLNYIRETGRKLTEIALEGRDWIYLLLVLICITQLLGIHAAGQMVIPLFILHSISVVANFGLHGHLRHAFQMSEIPAIAIWTYALRARMSLLLILSPLVLLFTNLTLTAAFYCSLWIIARFINEVLLVGARFNQRLNDWLAVRILLYLAIYFLLSETAPVFYPEAILSVLAIPEAVMSMILWISRISRFPVILSPRIDFTQLKSALPHFYAQLLFTFNYYLLILPAAYILPLQKTAEISFHVLTLVFGLVPAYLIWNDYRNARPSMSESDLTAATLALGIRGTIASTIIVLSGIVVHLSVTGNTPELHIALPQFLILLSHYYTIPSLHTLTEEGKLPWLVRLWIAGGFMQVISAIIISTSTHPELLFPVICTIALAQSLMVFLLRQIKFEVQA